MKSCRTIIYTYKIRYITDYSLVFLNFLFSLSLSTSLAFLYICLCYSSYFIVYMLFILFIHSFIFTSLTLSHLSLNLSSWVYSWFLFFFLFLQPFHIAILYSDLHYPAFRNWPYHLHSTHTLITYIDLWSWIWSNQLQSGCKSSTPCNRRAQIIIWSDHWNTLGWDTGRPGGSKPMDPKLVSATHTFHTWPICLKEWDPFEDTKTWLPAKVRLCAYGLTSSSNSSAQENKYEK